MFFIAFTGMNETAARLIALVLFAVTSLTDMLDGKIARKYNLITDFGKFLDPVADKLLVIGSYLAILVRYRDDDVFSMVMFWCLFVIFFRELAVTSLRMIVANKVVIAADIFGKI
jgi:CDP-diacylglycerol--glycerol-3-phosphate 3-phosphatidyltransferase